MVSPAVAKAAMESGVARKPVANWEDYTKYLRKLVNYDGKQHERIATIAKHELLCRRIKGKDKK